MRHTASGHLRHCVITSPLCHHHHHRCVIAVVAIASLPLRHRCRYCRVVMSLSSLSSHCCCCCCCCCRVVVVAFISPFWCTWGCWTASVGGPSSIAWDAAAIVGERR